MNAAVRHVSGAELPAYVDGVRQVYAEAFSAPPWGEDPSSADLYTARLADDALRPGFTAAVGHEGDTVTGFATAWPMPGVFPEDRNHGAVAAALGSGRTADWLCGALKVDELAVSAAARGTGLGATLLTAVTEPAEDGRCWLLTSLRAEGALRFYRRVGWYQVPAVVPGRARLTVLLGPRHPGRPDAA